MSVMQLSGDSWMPDFKCPNCGRGISVTWETEYGDAVKGESIQHCPKCSVQIIIDTTVTTTYTAR